MEYPDEGAINIYTDGSCLPKPRRGAFAGLFILINEEGKEEDYPLPAQGFAAATNNQMELEACVQALRLATSQHPPFERSPFRKLVIHTDSEYVASCHSSRVCSSDRRAERRAVK